MAAWMLLSLLRPDAHSDGVELTRRRMAAPSGRDTLSARRRYLRRRRARRFVASRRTAGWLLGVAAASLCIGGFAVFVFGS